MRIIILISRLILFLGLLFLAAKPVITRPQIERHSKTAVMIDQSRSMGVKDPNERLQTAQKITAGIVRKFQDSTIFSFSDNVRQISLEELSNIKATGNQTDLASALHQVFQNNNFQQGIVLSDGRQVGMGDAVVESASIGIPLLFIGMGNSSFYRDIAIRTIQSPPFSFKNIETSLTATISCVGYKGKKIAVKLKEEERIIGLQTIDINNADTETNVTFHWIPTSLGSKLLTVEADQFQGEVTFKNNKKVFSLDVGRDRFRVLYICGQPGWEYSFLRHQFKSDPAVELVTFVILRNAGNILNIPDAELALIPFPTQDDLMRQMATFDLVVFEEFVFTQYGLMPGLFESVRRKINEGGSLLIMGGPQTLGPGSPYLLTPIQDILPVKIEPQAVQYISDTFQLKPKIYSHPIMKLDLNPDESKKVWDNLPPLEGFTIGPLLKSGATSIAGAEYQGKEYPVLSAMEIGAGRVAMILTRTTWRWSMLGGKGNNTQYAYQQFWKNMVLWLTGAEKFKKVRVAVEGRNIRLDETGLARVWIYDEYFKPISDVDLKVQMTKPDGNHVSIIPDQETPGVFSFPIKGDQIGNWRLQVWAFRKGKKFGSDFTEFKVLEGFQEEEDLRPNHALLKEMAHASGGQFLKADDFTVKLIEEFDQQRREKGGEKVLVWTSPWFFSLLAFFLVFEWIWRKRKGYL